MTSTLRHSDIAGITSSLIKDTLTAWMAVANLVRRHVKTKQTVSSTSEQSTGMGKRGKRGKRDKGTKDKGQRTKRHKDTKTQTNDKDRTQSESKVRKAQSQGPDARQESRTQDAGRKGRTQDTQLQAQAKTRTRQMENGEVTMRVPWRDADDEEQSRRWRQVADSASQIPYYASYPIQPDEEPSLRALAWRMWINSPTHECEEQTACQGDTLVNYPT